MGSAILVNLVLPGDQVWSPFPVINRDSIPKSRVDRLVSVKTRSGMIRVHVIQRQPYQASVHSIACLQNREASVLPYHDQLGAQGGGMESRTLQRKKEKKKTARRIPTGYSKCHVFIVRTVAICCCAFDLPHGERNKSYSVIEINGIN